MTIDETHIKAAAAFYATAWNNHDASHFAELFAENADFVTFQGTWIQGRAAVQKAHQFIFDGPFKNTTIRYLEESIQMRSAEMVVYRAKWALDGRDADGKDFPTRTGMFIFVMQKMAGRWCLVAGQNTDINAEQIYHG